MHAEPATLADLPVVQDAYAPAGRASANRPACFELALLERAHRAAAG